MPRMYTVLLVEDDLLVCQLIAQLLEDEGWQVDVCLDGNSALKRLQGPRTYDLLITDEELPGVKGLDLVRYIRGSSERSQLPVIMFTSRHCAEEAIMAGANVFLTKPDDIKALVPTAHRLLQ